VIDAANGYAYFAATIDFGPCRIVKVALGDGADPPRRVGGVNLASGESTIHCAAIDPANGYAYFAGGYSSAKVVKVALGAGSAPPTRVGALTLPAGEVEPECVVIDTANGYAYFGCGASGSAGRVVKVLLGAGGAAPVRVGAVALPASELAPMCAVIDPGNGFAYFGTSEYYPGDERARIVKIALGAGGAAPSRFGALALPVGDRSLYCGAIDTANRYAYFGDSNGRIIKVSVGGPLPTRIASINAPSGAERPSQSVVFDPGGGYLYFGAGRSGVSATVIKVAPGAGNTAPTRVQAITLRSGEEQLETGLIDTINGNAYFGTVTRPGRVVKVSLQEKTGSDTLRRDGAVNTALTSEALLATGVLDAANGHAYFGTQTIPGRVIKVAMGAGADLPTRIGTLTLDTGEDQLVSGVVDAANGHAYFGTATQPGQVIKVALGTGSDLPTRLGAVTLNADEDFLASGVIDAANGYAYFGTLTTPGQVVKVALGAGTAAPARVASLTLNPDEDDLACAVIDTANGHAYFGADTMAPLTGQVIKVALGAGDAPPTRLGALVLPTGEERLISATIDPANGHGYFGTLSSPAQIIKVALGAGTAAPTRLGAITL